MAKSRTAPLQYVSVPTLELQAATIAVRVHCLIRKEIDVPISSSFFWTDLKITLQYINNESRRFKTYVANRVSEIRDASQLSPLQEDDAEIKNERPIMALMPEKPDKLHEIVLRYSSWKVLQRTVVWLLKFKEYLRCRKNKDTVGINRLKFLTTADLEKAKIAIVKLVQKQVYAQEIHDLEHKGNVRCSSKIVKLRPVLNDGVLRVGGRISEAPIAFGARFPMIIPPKHHVTQLLIVSFHQKLAHAGQNHILAQLREEFWIPKGKTAVCKAVGSCLSCKKQRAANMEQMMASLPAFSTTAYEPCFTHTGVDYFGPLNVKKGRSVVKRRGVIFTCMNSRAVHLELASSLESDCFINVLRRFMNRRGRPKVMYSDNGTNFVGAEREIRQSIKNWNQKQIGDELLQKGCQWAFQPPKASNTSGVWETLIRSTRAALRAILGESLADE